MEGRERLRLFVALLLPTDTLARLAAWQERELPREPGVRVVPRPNLHVTVAFLGSRPTDELAAISAAVRAAAGGASPLGFGIRHYRETQRVGMLVLADEAAGRPSSLLADDVQSRLASLGVYEPESRPWAPHVTVVRFRHRPRLRPALPELGRVVSSELAVMISRLRPSGAQYEILESVALGG